MTQLFILTIVALITTLVVIYLEWRTKQVSKLNTGIKAALAVVLVGLLISLIIVK